MDDTPTQTLSIPSLLAFAVFSFLAIRYFFFSPSANSTPNAWSSAPGSGSRNRSRAFPPDRVDTLAIMFPQLDRRDIEWDLVNNGGSVQATTEKVLSGGRLPSAPRNFTALYAAPPVPSPSSSNTRTQRTASKQQYQDLITRYGLSDRIAAAAANGEPVPKGDEVIQTKEKQAEKGGWTSSKTDRQALLKRRREEMVLAARRKMEEKERSEAKGKGRAT